MIGQYVADELVPRDGRKRRRIQGVTIDHGDYAYE
jgi:hypothetical protein